MPFIQRSGKFNFAKLSDVKTKTISTLAYNSQYPAVARVYNKWAIPGKSDSEFSMFSKIPGRVAGKPNSILRQCESSPGIWVYDFDSSVTIYMFSDGYKKYPYKGTNFEVELGANVADEDISNALQELYNYLKEEFEKLAKEN